MNLKNVNIYPDKDQINSSVELYVELEFQHDLEIPLTVSGRLLLNNRKVISNLTETVKSPKFHYTVKMQNINSKKEGQSVKYNSYLSAYLSPEAVFQIESLRENDIEKSVNLTVEIDVKFSSLPCNQNDFMISSFAQLTIQKFEKNIQINQAVWLNQYAEYLKIGKYLIVELQQPENNNITDAWIDFYNRLSDNVKEMEIAIKNTDWYKVMTFARRFLEVIKMDDNKPGNKELKEDFDILFKNDLHNDEAIKNLHEGIGKLFDFVSKYLHEKDKSGFSKSIPKVYKEDAFFIYSLSIGLLNLIGKKISKK